MALLDEIKKYVGLFSPILSSVPGAAPVLPLVNMTFAAIAEAEQIFGPGRGKEKYQHALNAAADAINIYNAAAGKNFNTSEMMESLGQMVNSGVRFLNAVKAFKHAS